MRNGAEGRAYPFPDRPEGAGGADDHEQAEA